jgi:Do/DeqQ family serine protease
MRRTTYAPTRTLRITTALCLIALTVSTASTWAQGASHAATDSSTSSMPSLAPIVKRVSPAVVNVATRGTVTEQQQRNPLMEDPFFKRFFDMPEQGPRHRPFQSAGSGVVVDAKQGLILTNAHVVENASEITVTTLDGHDYKATVIGADAPSDIAVIKVKDAKLTEAPLGDSSKAEVGDYVLAIGNPFGLQHTVTFGIVSALGRSGINPDGYEDFIQTDASINPGNSGGALVNLRGEVIGINSAILSRSGGNIGIGFAIPSNMAQTVMDQLVKYGEVKRGVLGVNIVTVTPDVADNLGSKDLQGALVSQVVNGSAAEKAGIKAGDVITAINGGMIKSSAELRNRIGLMRVGENVDITLLRDGKTKHLTAIVQGKSADKDSKDTDDEDNTPLHRALRGAELVDAPAATGVVVRAIEANSPASQSMLKPNDVISAVNRKPVANLKEFTSAAKDQASLILQVKRGANILVIVLR